jgi:hypothetical protein
MFHRGSFSQLVIIYQILKYSGCRICNCLAICKTGVEEIHYAGLLTTKTAKTAKRLFFAVFAVFAVQLFQPG